MNKQEAFSCISLEILLCLIGCSSGSCPDTWEALQLAAGGEKCYHFQQNSGTYSEVRSYCQTKGGDIVIINSEEENQFIYDRIQHFSATAEWGHDSVWIGADSLESGTVYQFVRYRDTGYDTSHRWDTATSIPEGYWNWWPAEPAHVGAENCAVMHKTYSKHWNDEECESSLYKRGAVCQLGDSNGANPVQTSGYTGQPTTEPATSLRPWTTSKIASTQDVITTKMAPLSSIRYTSVFIDETTHKSTTTFADAITERTSTVTSMKLSTNKSTKELTNTVTPAPSFPSTCERTGISQLSGSLYFIKKDEVCILNYELDAVTTITPTRCASQCMRQQPCVSFTFIVGSEENQCRLYQVTKNFNGVSLTTELSPGLPCHYYELDRECDLHG